MADYTAQLRSLMQPLGLTSFRALSRAADISEWQVEQLRKGKIAQMRVEVLLKLSQTLQTPPDQLIRHFSEQSVTLSPQQSDTSAADTSAADTSATDTAIIDTSATDISATEAQFRQEMQHLQTQLAHQKEQLQQEFQQTCIQMLESWLIQFPTAAYAAQQNPQIPASRLLPLMRPIEQLLTSWGVEPLAAVGAELPYNPQYHQLLQGTAQPGETVKVRYTGYQQGQKLLYRAQVSPL